MITKVPNADLNTAQIAALDLATPYYVTISGTRRIVWVGGKDAHPPTISES